MVLRTFCTVQVREAVAERDTAQQRVDEVRQRFNLLNVEFDALTAEHAACQQRGSSSASSSGAQDDSVLNNAAAGFSQRRRLITGL